MTSPRALATLAAVLAATSGCPRAPLEAPVTTPSPGPVAVAPPRPSPAAPATVPDAEASAEPLIGEAAEADPSSDTVTIKLLADPARKAHVFWGRKDLGLAPLSLTRPRGSGPLDLVIVTPGALTLHTRVFTDRDDKLSLRLFAESAAPTLFGYRPPEAAAPEKAAALGAVRPGRVTPR